MRQSVLAFPHALRYRLAYDASLVTDVLGIFTAFVKAAAAVAKSALPACPPVRSP